MATGGSTNKWKLHDLQDLEQYGLAAELESTKLGDAGFMFEQNGPLANVDMNTSYGDMSDALTELLSENDDLFRTPFLNIPSTPPPVMDSSSCPGGSRSRPQVITAVLRAPTAYCIKNTQEELTFVQKGLSYELHVSHSGGDRLPETVFKSVLMLTFSQLRMKNCEQEHFEEWKKEHSLVRLIEMDEYGCGCINSVENDPSFTSITFTWNSHRTATLAFKVNCLSSEFSARKHGGEKGVPICLLLETSTLNAVDEAKSGVQNTLVESLACNVKVFKDKGAERKQKQEQLKWEKLRPEEQASYHQSQQVTNLHPVAVELAVNRSNHSSPNCSTHQLPEKVVSFSSTPLTQSFSESPLATLKQDHTATVEHARNWLVQNRFGQFLSMFLHYTYEDLLRLSRRDLLDLCGAGDGIRLYNALRSQTVKVIYITTSTDKICQAVCLAQLNAQELGSKVAEKLGISPRAISTLVHLTNSGILVLLDDTMVRNMRDEECFLLRTIKEEDDRLQVIFQEHTPNEQQSLISIQGTQFRHH